MNAELIISILCLVSLLLLSWAALLYAKVNALHGEVEALKHYIRTKKKLETGPSIQYPEGGER